MASLCSYFAETIIIILKTVEVAKPRNLLCHVYKAKFLSKSRVGNSSNETLIRVFLPLCTHPAYILRCCKFRIIIFKTEEVAEIRTLLCHVYKTYFLSKSRVYNPSTDKLISSVTFMHMLCLHAYYG